MEGRTIVRPVRGRGGIRRRSRPAFNGGPDNRPASRGENQRAVVVVEDLQWRAGQSSGQSGTIVAKCWPPDSPSMEGRTIVRPVTTSAAAERYAAQPFNGGPDNRPASPGTHRRRSDRIAPFNGGPDNRPASLHYQERALEQGIDLQWRAGQSSGQSG